MDIRKCRMCSKEVDFDEPYCDHETMEESGWLNIPKAIKQRYAEDLYERATDKVVDDLVEKVAAELGRQAGIDISKKIKDLEDKE